MQRVAADSALRPARRALGSAPGGLAHPHPRLAELLHLKEASEFGPEPEVKAALMSKSGTG